MNYESKPALLVSFLFLDMFKKARDQYHIRDWALDSGAFSAQNAGVKIDLDSYIETCKDLMQTDKQLTEIFALDVIGNHKASLDNTNLMVKAGIPAIPTYHLGEPTDALIYLAKHFPKIAIGGMAKLIKRKKILYIKECFARIWPKPVHGFGCASRDILLSFPFHSSDATNWELAPCGFGNWESFGQLSIHGSNQNLRAEVEYYLKLEREVQARWSKTMESIKSQLDSIPKVYLGYGGKGAKFMAKSINPKLYLGHSGHDSERQKQNVIRLSILPTGQELKALKKKED
jgi:hypothetical protein